MLHFGRRTFQIDCWRLREVNECDQDENVCYTAENPNEIVVSMESRRLRTVWKETGGGKGQSLPSKPSGHGMPLRRSMNNSGGGNGKCSQREVSGWI